MNIIDKASRQAMVSNIIKGNRISNQDELSAELSKQGVEVTQATLSRDLKELRIVKMHTENGYFYALPIQGSSSASPNGVISIEISGQFAVIKTESAYASVVASRLDRAGISLVMGTLAGDDTVLVILKSGVDEIAAITAIAGAIPGIEKKLL